MQARRWMTAVLLACAAGSGCVGAAGAGAAAAATPVTHTIVIEGTQFAPATLTVNRGDTVVWRNKDPFPHTATAKGTFDSGSIAAGKSWRYRAKAAGEYAYLCTLHPNMKGMLVVR